MYDSCMKSNPKNDRPITIAIAHIVDFFMSAKIT